MAIDHPKGGRRPVPIDLRDEYAAILRSDLCNWIEGLRDELRTPKRLNDPDGSRAELAAYERLLGALDAGEIAIPDEEAERLLREAAHAHDSENGYREVVTTHDAMHELLAVLAGGET